jgi:hypothetical protein
VSATDAAMRGLFISAVSSATAFEETTCAFSILRLCHWPLNSYCTVMHTEEAHHLHNYDPLRITAGKCGTFE